MVVMWILPFRNGVWTHILKGVDTLEHILSIIHNSFIDKIFTERIICHSKFNKDQSEIIIDNESGCCNFDEQCSIWGWLKNSKNIPCKGEDDIESETSEEDSEVEVTYTDIEMIQLKEFMKKFM